MSTHIHIVEPYHSAAMKRMTDPLMQHLPEWFDKITISETPDNTATLNYHIPWHTLINTEPSESIQAALYTHVNPRDRQALVAACKNADHVVAMSETGADELQALAVPGEKISVIYAGHEDYPARTRNIGIIGYEQPNGRKRGHILIDLCYMMDLSPFQFVFSGAGWEYTMEKMANCGAQVINAGNLQGDVMGQLYQQLDLLLVTSYIEGGPLTVLEAYSAGVPVIAPPVGYAADLLPRENIYLTVEELKTALENFVAPVIERQELVKKYTWKRYAEQHAQLFERLIWLRTSTQTETDTSAPKYTA